MDKHTNPSTPLPPKHQPMSHKGDMTRNKRLAHACEGQTNGRATHLPAKCMTHSKQNCTPAAEGPTTRQPGLDTAATMKHAGIGTQGANNHPPKMAFAATRALCHPCLPCNKLARCSGIAAGGGVPLTHSNRRILAVMLCLQKGHTLILSPHLSHVWWPQPKARLRCLSMHTAQRRLSALA